MWTFIELLTTFFDSWLATYFVIKFNNKKWHECKLAYFITVLVAAVTITFDKFIHFSEIQLFLIILIMILYSLTFKENKMIHRILPSILIFLYLAIVNTFALVFYSLLFNIKIIDLIASTGLYRGLLIVTSKVVLSLVVYIILKYSIRKQKYSILEAITVLVFPIMSMAFLTVIMRIGVLYDINDIIGYILIAVVGIMLINILIYYLLYTISIAKEEETKARLELQKRTFEEKFYKELEELYMKNQLLRHDFKNQCLCIGEYLENSNIAGAQEYLNELYDSIPSKKIYVDTSDTSVAFIINKKLDDATKLGITPTIYIDKSVKLNINSVDSVRLIGNLLDNAIEASTKSTEKTLLIEIVNKQGYSAITIKNSIDHPVLLNNKKLVTTKKEKSLHGFGLRSIEKIVTQNDGMFQVYEEVGTFCAQVLFPIG